MAVDEQECFGCNYRPGIIWFWSPWKVLLQDLKSLQVTEVTR